MIYTISIDWLAIHCYYCPPYTEIGECQIREDYGFSFKEWEPVDTPLDDSRNLLSSPFIWKYKLCEYGTRQFAHLHKVSTPNDEGGWDDFAEVQSVPHSGILHKASVIIRFVNRSLYMPDFWERANQFLKDNNFIFQGISRIDICADFNQFEDMTAEQLIEGFAAKKFRHVGQGVGALYFNHGILLDKNTKSRDYGVQYTGLSFGTHSSDFRIYLYNKTFELLTQGDKPWIRDRWMSVGLDSTRVWRLEVSIKSEGCKFKDRTTGKIITVNNETAADDDEIGKIYHSLVQKKFAFVKNRRNITNITREPRIQLFDLHPVYDHRTIRNVSPGKRFEKMFIKALYQLGDLYRGHDIKDSALLAQSLSFDIASNTDLTQWMSEKLPTWEKPTHK